MMDERREVTLTLVGGPCGGREIQIRPGYNTVCMPVMTAVRQGILANHYDARTGQWMGVQVDYQEELETDMVLVTRWAAGSPHRPDRRDLEVIERPERLKENTRKWLRRQGLTRAGQFVRALK